ncbi:MAG: zinc-ribbon domain-containing protein [Polyangiaceae bacterium]
MAETIADVAALAALWDAEKNEQTADQVLAKSYHTAWWKCPNGHSFQRKPRMMSRDAVCPTCQLGGSSFADTHPGLAKRWHPDKNDTTPQTITASFAANCWWICEQGHAFSRSPLQMVNDSACPVCALASESLAARYPDIAAEWHPHKNGEVRADQVEPDHKMTAWWVCTKGHEFRATVRARTQGSGRCPQCYGAWTLDRIRTFVQSLLGHVNVLTPSELFALAMQAGALRGAASKPFVKALTTGRFPREELETFAEGKPSLVDDFAADGELTLEIVEGRPEKAKPVLQDDPFALPAAPDDDYEPDSGDIDVSAEVTEGAAELDEGNSLPVVETRKALAALDSPLVASADAETVKFLLDSAKAKLWRHAYLEPEEAERQARTFDVDTYSRIVRDRFLAELDAANSLQLPSGYAFRPTPTAKITEPHLMQRHVAVSVAEKRRFGNWSGMGAGKTLSALLATRVVEADLTIICCPNAVVTNWEKEIGNAFPASQVQTKTWAPTWPDAMGGQPRYLILNFEQFQQPDSEAKLMAFLDRHVVDFVVIDEIHFAKQRDENAMSRRKRLVQGLILEAGKKNAELCVLGMSGTPVINTLQEGRSLVEMITGHRHDDLETKATVQNCMRLYQRLVTLGRAGGPTTTSSSTSRQAREDLRRAPRGDPRVGRGTVLEMEQVLTKVRLPTILEHHQPGKKTSSTPTTSRDRRSAAQGGQIGGYRPGSSPARATMPTSKASRPETSMLIASSRVSTGVDGLQHVCDTLGHQRPAMTNAEYEQLRARLWRQGSRFAKVTVVIPVTYAYVNGERWSYCESKLHRLEYKKSISDAAVTAWFRRVTPHARPGPTGHHGLAGPLEDGVVETIERHQITIPLSREPAEERRRNERYGDFSRPNNRWYAANSQKTHARLEANPEEWASPHTLYQELRQRWEVVPFEEEIDWLKQREGLIVGDFGCGEALIAAAASERHQIHSFDHIAINKHVIACDISAVPMDEGALDVAIFCLSLMGANFTAYLREAHRCLRLDGDLHIWEPASYFDDDGKQFCADLGRLGFDVLPPRKEGLFLRIRAIKNATNPDPSLEVRFRGRA